MRVLPVGRSAALVEVSSTDEAVRVYAAARAWPGAVDVVPAARSVLVDGLAADRARRLLDALPAAEALPGQRPHLGLPDPATPDRRRPGSGPPDTRSVVELPTTYDGPDLADVARLWDMTTAEVVATHTGTDLDVAFCGFAPGFAYLTGLGRQVPRLPTPRPRVEPGSVGLAGEFTGVYPTASPGGWRLVGRTAVRLWDADADPPALLTPGTRARFLAVTAAEARACGP